MNCKILAYFLALTLIVSSCAFSGCLDSGSSSNNSSNGSITSNTSVTTNNTSTTNATTANTSVTNTTTANTSAKANTSITNSSGVPIKSGPVGISEAEFQAAAAVTEYSFVLGGVYVMEDMSVEYNQSSNTIMIAIIVSDSTDGAIAKALADATLKMLNAEVNYYNNSIKLSDTSNYSANYYGRYHGGLYDECNVTIGIAPVSHSSNPDYFYVLQYIPAGKHTPIYRLR